MDLDYYMSLPYRVEIIKDTDEEGSSALEDGDAIPEPDVENPEDVRDCL